VATKTRDHEGRSEDSRVIVDSQYVVPARLESSEIYSIREALHKLFVDLLVALRWNFR